MNTKQIEKELLDTKLIENEFIHNKDNTKDLNKCSSYKSSKRDKFFENIKRENHMDDQHNENIYINIKNNKSTHTYKKKNNHIFHKNVYYNILIVLYYLFNQHIKKELYHFNMLKNKMQSSFFMNRFYITTRYKYLNKKYINFINFIKVLKENHIYIYIYIYESHTKNIEII
ncbi:hypothetical protein PFFCH_03442 [Plasmodium falciparum FCH/4]|uniref:Uncharacterized protein n=1 Tax=Plasmodium falciparum FCH/4 TaxID=1036724 RepID=A0A024VLH2_PLAFA|nr:hypothetical protein PFFCH_03442 [Plasmodium falciparum FCH/4]